MNYQVSCGDLNIVQRRNWQGGVSDVGIENDDETGEKSC